MGISNIFELYLTVIKITLISFISSSAPNLVIYIYKL